MMTKRIAELIFTTIVIVLIVASFGYWMGHWAVGLFETVLVALEGLL